MLTEIGAMTTILYETEFHCKLFMFDISIASHFEI